MARLQKIKDEITTNPEGITGYGGSDKAVAAILNVFDRAAEASINALRNYFLLNRKAGSTLTGRLFVTAESAIGTDPLTESITLSLEHKCAAIAMSQIVDPSSLFSLDLNNSNFGNILNDLAGGNGCKVIGVTNKNAIIALSESLTSRGIEIGVGYVREEHVRKARMLP